MAGGPTAVKKRISLEARAQITHQQMGATYPYVQTTVAPLLTKWCGSTGVVCRQSGGRGWCHALLPILQKNPGSRKYRTCNACSTVIPEDQAAFPIKMNLSSPSPWGQRGDGRPWRLVLLLKLRATHSATAVLRYLSELAAQRAVNFHNMLMLTCVALKYR